MKEKNVTIVVKGSEITIIREHASDYISLTDMVRSFGDDTIIYNWLRNRNTIEFLGIWEQINNSDFKPLEFERFKNEAGLNRFNLSLIQPFLSLHEPAPASTLFVALP